LLQHLLNKEAALLAADKGKAPVAPEEGGGPSGANNNGKQAPEQPAGGVQQEDLNSCPICLDELTSRTITSCGHHYCSTCIREVSPPPRAWPLQS
jgi:E3 ubiquitin-protein ligase SHPRH